MKPLNKCKVCGKSVHGTLLCKDCETKVLQENRGRKRLYTLLFTILGGGILYILWNGYQEKQGQVDTTLVTGAASGFGLIIEDFFSSPYMLLPAVIFFIILAFLVGVKLSK